MHLPSDITMNCLDVTGDEEVKKARRVEKLDCLSIKGVAVGEAARGTRVCALAGWRVGWFGGAILSEEKGPDDGIGALRFWLTGHDRSIQIRASQV